MISPDPVKPERGRKRKEESRAEELRQALLAWKQMPEYLRPSLRALARQLGVSHQLLAHYHERLDEWRAKEYFRRAREIWQRASAENRPMTPSEEQQVCAYNRSGAGCYIHFRLGDVYKRWDRELEQDVRAGRPPSAHTLKMLRIFASKDQRAQALIEKYWPSSVGNRKNNLPPISLGVRKSFRGAVGEGGNSAKVE